MLCVHVCHQRHDKNEIHKRLANKFFVDEFSTRTSNDATTFYGRITFAYIVSAFDEFGLELFV